MLSPNINVTADKLEEAMLNEIEKVKNELIDETEFQKLRNKIESDYISKFETMGKIASNLAIYYIFFGNTGI